MAIERREPTGAERQEQSGGERPEGKKETPPINIEQKDSPPIDVAFSSDVKKYFDRRKAEVLAVKNPDETDEMAGKFYNEQGILLKNLANPRSVGVDSSREYSFALSDLAGTMGANLEAFKQETYPEAAAVLEKEYVEAKKIFMASCAKLYPDKTATAKADFSNIKYAIRTLEKLGNLSDAKKYEESISDVAIRENPRRVLQSIEAALSSAGGDMKSTAFSLYENVMKGNSDRDKKIKGMSRLDSASATVYELQLMRDQLVEKIYGRKDITPSEQKEMDEARDTVMEGKKATREKPRTGNPHAGTAEPVKRPQEMPRQKIEIPTPAEKRTETKQQTARPEQPKPKTENREADAERREAEMLEKVFKESGILLHSSFRFKVEGSNHTGLQDLAATYKAEF